MQHKAVVISFYFEPLHWKNNSLLFKVDLSKIGHDFFLFAMKPSNSYLRMQTDTKPYTATEQTVIHQRTTEPTTSSRTHPQPPPPSLKMKTKPHPSSNLQSPMLNQSHKSSKDPEKMTALVVSNFLFVLPSLVQEALSELHSKQTGYLDCSRFFFSPEKLHSAVL